MAEMAIWPRKESSKQTKRSKNTNNPATAIVQKPYFGEESLITKGLIVVENLRQKCNFVCLRIVMVPFIGKILDIIDFRLIANI